MRFLRLKALRESRKFALARVLAGAANLGGVAFKYSKVPHGMIGVHAFAAMVAGVSIIQIDRDLSLFASADRQFSVSDCDCLQVSCWWPGSG